ncbi:MAG TPA: hypothetical protein VL856_17610 [Acidimicrobiia bacterium]|nr:hypothetical protein [Acidimicrobiia bacterium]
MNLFTADMQRFAARRLVRAMLMLTIGATIVIVGIVAAKGHRYTEQIPGYSYGDQFGQYQTFPTMTFVHDTRLDIGRTLSDVLAAVSICWVCAAAVLGASFVGAEYGGQGLSTQLLYEPGRWRTHASKLTAVGASCAALAFISLVAVTVAMFVGAKSHGVASGLTREFWTARSWDLGRGVVATAAAGMLAYTVTLVFRRTAVGAIAILIQIPISNAFQQNHKIFGTIARALPYYGLQVFIFGHDRLPDVEFLKGVTTTPAALVLATVWVVACAAAAGAVFARAEIR